MVSLLFKAKKTLTSIIRFLTNEIQRHWISGCSIFKSKCFNLRLYSLQAVEEVFAQSID